MASDRYQASGPEGEWQPGSAGQVLRNRPGITDPAEIDKVELELLLQLYDHVLQQDFPDHRLSVADISEWHRLWLGNLYDWAGRERSVNIGKDGFHFAAIQRGMEMDYSPMRALVSCALAARNE